MMEPIKRFGLILAFDVCIAGMLMILWNIEFKEPTGHHMDFFQALIGMGIFNLFVISVRIRFN